MASIILGTFSAIKGKGAYWLPYRQFLVFLGVETSAALMLFLRVRLLSFGHLGVVFFLWIALFLLTPLVLGLVFHFEVSMSSSKPEHVLYRSSRLWFSITVMDTIWGGVWVLRSFQKRHFAIQVASASIFIFYCDFFFFYTASQQLELSRFIVDYIIEPIGAFLLGFYAWTIMHFLAFDRLFLFKMKLNRTRFSGFSRFLLRKSCILYLVCASLFGGVFIAFCLVKNEVRYLPSEQNRHLDPNTMGIHFAFQIVALRVIINHSFLRRGLQSLCYTIVLGSTSILIFNYYCLDFDELHNPYNLKYIQMYSLGASWSVYIIIVSLYHFSPALMQILTITSFIFLNLFQGLIYPQSAILPSFFYTYIAPLTRALFLCFHLSAFIYFLVKAKSRLLSIVQAGALLLYLWGFSIVSGKWLTDQKLKPDFTFHRLLPMALFEYVLVLLPSAYLILWSELLYTRYRFTQLYGVPGLQAYKIPLRQKLHSFFSPSQCQFKLCSAFFLVFGAFLPVAAFTTYLVFELRTPSSLPQQRITENRHFFLYASVLSFVLAFFGSYMVKHILKSLKVNRNCTEGFLFLVTLLGGAPLCLGVPLLTFNADYQASDFLSHLPSCFFISFGLLTLYFSFGCVNPIQQLSSRQLQFQKEEEYACQLLESDDNTHFDSNFIRFLLQRAFRPKSRPDREPDAKYFWRVRISQAGGQEDEEAIQLLVGTKQRHNPKLRNENREYGKERRREINSEEGRRNLKASVETEEEKELRITEQFERELNSDRNELGRRANRLRMRSTEEYGQRGELQPSEKRGARLGHYRLQDEVAPRINRPSRSNSMVRSHNQMSALYVRSETEGVMHHSYPSPFSQLMRSIGSGQNVKVTRLELDINGSRRVLNEDETREIIQDLINAKRVTTPSNILETPISFQKKEELVPGVLHNLVLQEYATRVSSQRRVILALYRSQHFALKLKDDYKLRKNCHVDRLNKYFASFSFAKFIKEQLSLQDITTLARQFVDIFDNPERVPAESLDTVVQDFLSLWSRDTRDKVNSNLAKMLLFEQIFYLTLMESNVVTLPLEKLTVSLAASSDQVFTEVFSLVFDIHAVLLADSKFCLTREKFQHLWEKLRLYEIIKGEETEEQNTQEHIEKADLMNRLSKNLKNQRRHQRLKQSVKDLTQRLFRIYPFYSRYFLLRILNRIQNDLLMRKESKEKEYSNWQIELKRDCRECVQSLLHFPDFLFCSSESKKPYPQYNPTVFESISEAFISKNIEIQEEYLLQTSPLVVNCLESLKENPPPQHQSNHHIRDQKSCLVKSSAGDIVLRFLGSISLALLSLEWPLLFSLSAQLRRSLSSLYLAQQSYHSVSQLQGSCILHSLFALALMLQILAMNRSRQYNRACRNKCDRVRKCSGLVSYMYLTLLSTLFLPLLSYVAILPFRNNSFLFGFVNLFSLALFCLLYSFSFLPLFERINQSRLFKLSSPVTLLSFWLRLIDSVLTVQAVSASLILLIQTILFGLYISLSGFAFTLSRRASVINIWEGLFSLNQAIVKVVLIVKALEKEREESWVADEWLYVSVGVGYLITLLVGIARVARNK